MTALPLLNARIFAGGLDAAGFSNQGELSSEVADLDVTVFAGNGWHQRIGGLRDSAFSLSGFWDAGTAGKPDDRLIADLGTKQPLSVGPNGAAVGDLAYVTAAMQSSYKFGGAVGDVLPFSVEGAGSGPLGRGVFLHDAGSARTANGSGAAVQWLAAPDGAVLVAAVHVLSVAGSAAPTLTVNVQSDDNQAFATPTTRLTFNAATAVSGQAMQLAGPIADTYWRVTYGVTGTTPSFLFVASIGIAS